MTEQTDNGPSYTGDVNAILMGGGGAPTAKFAEPGGKLQGEIVSPPTAYQERDFDKNNPGGGALKFYKQSGDPIWAVRVDVQTSQRDPSIEDDDGKRRLYVEGRYFKADVGAAVAKAGARGLEVGGKISIEFTRREDPMDRRSRKHYDVTYWPPSAASAPAPSAPAAPAGDSWSAPSSGGAKQSDDPPF